MKTYAVQYWGDEQGKWITVFEMDHCSRWAITEADRLSNIHHGPGKWLRGGRVYNQIDGYVAH